jgi:hypothetical protein
MDNSLNKLIDLDDCVLNALELFVKRRLPKMNNEKFKRPLVVGSGNAAAAGRIIFEKKDAVFADESGFEKKLKYVKAIDGVILISAFGGKHAPIIAKTAKKYKKEVILLTNNENALAREYADRTLVFPKNPEPYTYNVSTYMGFILSHTGEDPEKILDFIRTKIDQLKLPDFSKFDKYFIVVPAEFEGIIRMFQIKFMELFGRRIARDIETKECMKHATTVVPSHELFISFGAENRYGKNNFYVPLPENAGYGAIMAIGYYIIGKIQKAKPPWFKQNLLDYTKRASEIFGQEIKPIVE